MTKAIHPTSLTPYWPPAVMTPSQPPGPSTIWPAAVASPDWEETLTAYARCARIVRGLDRELPLQPAAYKEKVEHELHSACDSAAAKLKGAANSAEQLGPVPGRTGRAYQQLL